MRKEEKQESAPAVHTKTTMERVMEEKERKSKLVKCRFINPTQPNAKIGPFPFKKYPGKIEMYTFEHGKEYTVPEYILDHINEYVGETEFYNVVDANGQLMEKPGKKTRFQLSVLAYL